MKWLEKMRSNIFHFQEPIKSREVKWCPKLHSWSVPGLKSGLGFQDSLYGCESILYFKKVSLLSCLIRYRLIAILLSQIFFSISITSPVSCKHNLRNDHQSQEEQSLCLELAESFHRLQQLGHEHCKTDPSHSIYWSF